MTTFSFPAQLLPRLSRLVLAADSGNTVLDHLALRITQTAFRLSATDGKMLASMVHELTDVQGEPTDVILDRVQIVAACKLLSKASGRISVIIGETEARFTSGSVSAIVRLREGTYPKFENMWQRTEGHRWLPCAASLDPTYRQSASYYGKVDPALSVTCASSFGCTADLESGTGGVAEPSRHCCLGELTGLFE